MTVREENRAPCWNSTPQRRSIALRSAGDSSSRFSPNTSIVPGALRHEAEDRAGQHRLALAGGADEAEDLAPVNVEVEVLHDGALAEADLEAAHADDGLALRSAALRAGLQHGAQ